MEILENLKNDTTSTSEYYNLFKNLNVANMKLNFIINADDLGICEERDRGVFELFEKGITSATIIVNTPNFKNSIKKAKELKLPLGLHLNLTEGEPIFKNNLKTNSLINHDSSDLNGLMHGKFELREKLRNGEISLTDIKNEIIAQVYFTYKIER